MEDKKNMKIFIAVIGLLVLGTVGAVLLRGSSGVGQSGPGKYDAFATCLKDQGAIFYGAFWCPHCQATKKMFGTSAKLLPYTECSTPDAQGQTQMCIDKGIQSYPTWEFKDGSRLMGELTFAQLAEKTSCTLPDATPAAPINTGASSSIQ